MNLTPNQIRIIRYMGRKSITLRKNLRPAMHMHNISAEILTEEYLALKDKGLVGGDRVRNGFAKKPRQEMWLTDAGRIKHKELTGMEPK